MALNASQRKKLAAALDASNRSKLTDDQVEEIALALIDGKKTPAELAETYEVSVQTLKKRLRRAAEGPQAIATE
jgi:DNA-directed RNA polymerase specialized sigma24 family protein